MQIERIALTSDRKSLEQVVFSGHYNVNEGYNSNGDNAKVLNGTNMYNPVGSTVKRIPQGRVGVETRHMVQGMEGQLKELRTEREKISEGAHSLFVADRNSTWCGGSIYVGCFVSVLPPPGHRQVKSEMDEVSKQLSVSKGESRKIEDKKKDLERKAHQKRNEIEAKHEKAQNTSETNEEANLAQLRSEYFEAEQEAEHAEQVTCASLLGNGALRMVIIWCVWCLRRRRRKRPKNSSPSSAKRRKPRRRSTRILPTAFKMRAMIPYVRSIDRLRCARQCMLGVWNVN